MSPHLSALTSVSGTYSIFLFTFLPWKCSPPGRSKVIYTTVGLNDSIKLKKQNRKGPGLTCLNGAEAQWVLQYDWKRTCMGKLSNIPQQLSVLLFTLP